MKYAFVRFRTAKYEYIYACANENIRVGNVVSAPVNGYRESHRALVIRIAELADEELPLPKNRILRIAEILSESDAEGIFADK